MIQASRVQLNNTSYVYCFTCSPPKVKFPAITIYLTPSTPLSTSQQLFYLGAILKERGKMQNIIVQYLSWIGPNFPPERKPLLRTVFLTLWDSPRIFKSSLCPIALGLESRTAMAPSKKPRHGQEEGWATDPDGTWGYSGRVRLHDPVTAPGIFRPLI